MNTNKKKSTLEILEEQSMLKQDVFCVTKELFKEYKEVIANKIDAYQEKLNNDKVRLKFVDKNEFEVHAYVGSDLLVFSMHTNVFSFPKEHAVWKNSYVEKDKKRAYCGVIHIYNFLADSFLQTRLNDAGYLLGRIYINKEKHFFVEGKGHLGTKYRDFMHSELTRGVMDELLEVAIRHAAEFDLLTPPYDMISAISVQQIQAMSSSAQMKTGKRLGFRFRSERDEIK